MALSLRRRRATVAVAALVAGTPPLLPGVAVAAPVPPSWAGVREPDRMVTFGTPGTPGLRCAAASAQTSLMVPPESTVRVVNRTGQRARLLLDGVARGELLTGSSTDVLFRPDPAALALKPICVFPAESVVRVEVGPMPHGPDVADPGSAEAPRDAVPVGDPPPYDRLGGASAALVRPVAPARPAGTVALLALVATICVVGVTAGVIRAILAQRATQTLIA